MGWLIGWSHRKKLLIEGSSGAGVIRVGESSGAVGCDFHVEGHSAKRRKLVGQISIRITIGIMVFRNRLKVIEV